MIRLIALSFLLTTGLANLAAAQDGSARGQTLGATPPEGAVYLFCDSLCNWVRQGTSTPAKWPVADEVATVKGGNIQTRGRFGDFQLHVEFSVPYLPDKTGQGRGNSGIYLLGLYELQILDSYGLVPKSNDCGAIYQQIVPSVNACKPPLQWQTYDITFHAAKATGGEVKKARLTVVQNGRTIIDDKEIGPSPGGVKGVKEGDRGPIMIQDHGDAVQFRNIWILPLD